MSSAAGGTVVVVDDCAAVVLTADSALLDVAVAGAANVVGVDNDEEDVESTVGLAPPNANVPNGTAGLVPVVGLPNEIFGAATVVVVALELVVLSFLKLPNVIGLADGLILSSGLTVPNVSCGHAFDVDAAADDSAMGFEPNENLPLGAPKSMPPLPNEKVGFGVDASLVEMAAVALLSLAC